MIFWRLIPGRRRLMASGPLKRGQIKDKVNLMLTIERGPRINLLSLKYAFLPCDLRFERGPRINLTPLVSVESMDLCLTLQDIYIYNVFGKRERDRDRDTERERERQR